jgi:adenylate cyclase
MSSQRSVPLAVVFADVVGSTRLYEQLGDERARDTVTRCMDVMTSATRQHGGKVVKTMGDEVLSTFQTADAAVEAACRMHRMIKDAMADAGVAVDIRIGLHYGPVMEEVDDVFGATVHTANRMTSQAKAKQIVTTEATVQALSPTLQAMTRQIDVTTLKGRSDGVALFEVLWGQREDSTYLLPQLTGLIKEQPAQRRLVLRYYGKEVVVGEASPQVTMGRAEECDLVVKDTLISRNHARIEYARGKFVLHDQSTNGTCVILQDGDELYIRRDNMRLVGSGIIGLGRVARPDTVHTVNFGVYDADEGND